MSVSRSSLFAEEEKLAAAGLVRVADERLRQGHGASFVGYQSSVPLAPLPLHQLQFGLFSELLASLMVTCAAG